MKAATPEPRPIAVRAYADPPQRRPKAPGAGVSQPLGASDWKLIFDTETTTDAAQQLRFGAYQVRKSGVLWEAGLFYDPLSLGESEQAVLFAYAEGHDLKVRVVDGFVKEVFFPYVYELRGQCVGFNLPFDLSRIAIGHSSARVKMRGGFSLQLSPDRRRPRVQVKHLSNRSALIRFTVPPRQTTTRGMRKRGQKVPARRGHFVDVRTLAGALLGGSWSLGRLAEHLGTEHGKLDAEEHGGPLTEEYIRYAVQDVQATWESFERLNERYEGYGLTETEVSKIYSEASLGKTYLKQMGVRPLLELQPDFPSKLLGIIMSTYYGGRSEVHLRRKVARILYCDFLSMYPTVCTLMNLWSFAIAKHVKWRKATIEVRKFLEDVTLEDLQKPETWPQLCALVQVQPDADIFPVRSRYGEESQHTIGSNYLTSEQPLWFTLADCIASKLFTGDTPKVLRAIRFEPVGVQKDLQSVDIAGNSEYHIDPCGDDLYKRLIDLRSEVKTAQKAARKTSDEVKAAELDAEQQALKICANATSYGIFVELNVTEQDKAQEVICYTGTGKSFSTQVRNVEKPGRYFHPLLATLITGAARLMLAIAERLAEDAGITWAFCDTDSMALARPDGMDDADFLTRAEQVQDWFTPLNPYEHKGPVFKIEDANYRVERGKLTDELEPLYCYAVSAKRYALFNLDGKGRPVLRKASAHGLGHLLPPYREEQAPRKVPKPVVPLPELGVERWQYDLWYRIVQAGLGDTPEQVCLDSLPGFQNPAVSRYAATTPDLLRWFRRYNRGKPYREQVKPFNFLFAYQSDSMNSGRSAVKSVSAYEEDLRKAVAGCFNRETGDPVPSRQLKSYQEALAQYHLHPEAKFQGGDYTDRGVTSRRHVVAMAVEHIGKEANRWEEQFYLGVDLDTQTEYGTAPEDYERMHSIVVRAGEKFGQRALAKAARISLREVAASLCGKREPTSATLTKLYRTVPRMETATREQAEYIQKVLKQAEEVCQRIGLRRFAEQAEIDAANLAHVVNGQRRPSRMMLTKLEIALSHRSNGKLNVHGPQGMSGKDKACTRADSGLSGRDCGS
jgi:transcriptional regulator with XRE-family HTH domain